MSRSLACVAVAAGLLIASGCGSGVRLPGSNTSNGGNGDPIKIGMLVEQTGQFSWYGEENLEGAQLWADDANARGGLNGRQIELVPYNTESAPEKAVSGARKLQQQDKVAATIGLGLVGEAQAVAAVVNDTGPPTYSTSGAYAPQGKMMFGGTVFVGDTQKRAIQFLTQRGIKRVALLLTNDASGQVAETSITAAAPQAGIEITRSEKLNPDDVDVTPQLTQIRASNPQALIAWVVGKPLGVVLKGTQQLGMDLPVVTSHGNITPGFLESITPVQTGPLYMFGTRDLIWRDLPDADPQKKLIADMQARFQAKFNKEAGIGVGTSYDGLTLIAEAIKRANSTEPAKVASALESLQGIPGIIGTYNLSPQDHRGLDSSAAIPMEVAQGNLQAVK